MKAVDVLAPTKHQAIINHRANSTVTDVKEVLEGSGK